MFYNQFYTTMIFFLKERPSGSLEPSSLFFIENSEGNADLLVSNVNGNLIDVATMEIISDQTTDQVQVLKNKANGVAGLDANKKLAESSIPANFLTSTQIQSAINGALNDLVDAAPEQLNTLKEISTALGQDPNFASTMTTQLAGKQSTLSNATQIAKIGDGTFDGKPLVVVSATEW